uniref:Pancreatic trypsin inhibitor n=1 Tax=Rhipicephalus zambeziensis TaxID=60191 RepID=A0A224YBB9_9ACAR
MEHIIRFIFICYLLTCAQGVNPFKKANFQRVTDLFRRDNVRKDTQGQMPEACKHPPGPGSCGPAITAWYFNASAKACKLFPASACVEGDNYFITLIKCKQKCLPTAGKRSAICLTPPSFHQCKGHNQAWVFDYTDLHCKMISHAGRCTGRNTFTSEITCQMACLPRTKSRRFCSQVQSPGRCWMKQGKWYFSSVKNDCFQFAKNHCGRGDNSFPSYQKCMRRCSCKSAQFFSLHAKFFDCCMC